MRALPALLLVTLLSSTSLAAPATIAERYKAAVKLENAGNVVDALAAFEALPVKDFNARLHIASCKRKLGRMLESAKDYEAIRDDPTADVPTKETADGDLDAVRAATPQLLIKLSRPAIGLTVTVDTSTVTPPLSHAVDPGSHTIVARQATKTIFERTISVAEGTKLDVVIDVPAPPPVSDEPVKTPPVPLTAAEETSGGHRTAGFIVGAVGLAAFGVGTWSLLRIAPLERERDDLAAANDRAADDRANDARTMQTVSRISFAAGAVALITGGYLVMTSSERSKSSVAVTTNGLGFSMVGSW